MSVTSVRRVVGLTLLVLVLAACGSRLDPNDVVGARGIGDDGYPGGSPAAHGDVGTGEGVGADEAGDAGFAGDVDATAADDGGTTADGDPVAGSAGGEAAGGSGGGGDTSATGGQKARSCNGFKNQTGITDKTITIANVSDISGPAPGLFEASQLATRAYVEYFNSQGDICGRKLSLINLDSRIDAGADQQAYTKACEEAFAAVGSMSAYDAGGAGVAEKCGIPDMRAASTMPERQNCSTCFGTNAVTTHLVAAAHLKWLKKDQPEAVRSAAFLYTEIGAATANAKAMSVGWEKAGFTVKHVQGIDPSEFNYAPYVQELKNKDIKAVGFLGPYQNTVKLQQAMKQQGFKPDIFIQDGTIYDQRYVDQAGDVAEGTMVYLNHPLFTTNSREMQLYTAWLQQVKPGAAPNYFGLYAWSAARLFVEKASALGGDLNRKSLVAEFAEVSKWTANGLHAEQDVKGGRTANCAIVAQYSGGAWKKVSPGEYLCAPLIDVR